ncbi:MAG: hypothetical protein A3E79_06370 [Burkholderiales bacterium RIFCSPHIGHO2_12_FULL_61_11]|nr:MAG: hypothetical protein A3E79_06370 [Burkholderiales bacterium RIFCSPHIGHO2_12_FULL_61_11]
MSQPSYPHDHGSVHQNHVHQQAVPTQGLSVLAWPAWLRVLAVLPVVLVLWLAVTWANEGAALW